MGDDVRKVFMDVYKEKELKKLFPVLFLESVKSCMRYNDQSELFEKLLHMLMNISAPAKMWDDAVDDNFREVMLSTLIRGISSRRDELDAEIGRILEIKDTVTVAINDLLNSKAALPADPSDDDDDLAKAMHYDPGQSAKTPRYLYHGTSTDNKDNILSLGLLPMKRRYVYLYEDKDVAYKVGARHGDKTSVLQIDAVAFVTQGNDLSREDFGFGEVWLADAIPAIFINELTSYTPPQD